MPTKQGDLRVVHVHRCLRLARAGDNCRRRCPLAGQAANLADEADELLADKETSASAIHARAGLVIGAGENGDALIKGADVAMFRAKAAGSNNYQYFGLD